MTCRVTHSRGWVGSLASSPIEAKLIRTYAARRQDETGDCLHIACPAELIKFQSIPERQEFTLVHKPHFEVVCPQFPIGRYRVDYVMGRVVYDVENDAQGNPVEILRRLPLIVVECDGHDFHEKTKEQAARDKERDREIQIAGYAILRFTGSEIHNNPGDCVDAINRCFAEARLRFRERHDVRRDRMSAALTGSEV